MSGVKVVVTGAAGRMGRVMSAGLAQDDRFQVVGRYDRSSEGVVLSAGLPSVSGGLAEMLATADVMLDLTHFSVAGAHVKSALQAQTACVVGTSGIPEGEVAELDTLARAAGLPVLIVPNFAVGAVLMMRFAEMAAPYFRSVEVIERHSVPKADAPSGTGVETARRVSRAMRLGPLVNPNAVESHAGARGAQVDGVRVHSLRMEGSVAHQEVLFGGTGETLTIRHDSLDRTSFLEGVKLAVAGVRGLPAGVTVGLDALLFG